MKYFYLLIGMLACLFTGCSQETDSLPGDDTGAGDGSGLILSASAAYVELEDGNITFTVRNNGIDVTENAAIYQKKETGSVPLSGNTYQAEQVGSLVFFASYEGEISSYISVEVVDGMLSTPADPEPDRYDGFKRRALAIEGTSMACGYCPMMMAGLQEFQKSADSDKAVVVTVHGVFQDLMVSEYSTQVLNYLNVNALPSMQFNMNRDNSIGLTTSDNPTTIMGKINSSVSASLSEPASSAICAATAATDQSIKVTADIKIAKTASYRVTAWVIEDNLTYQGQTNYYPELSETYTFSTYNEVLRCIANTDQVTGSNLGGNEIAQQNTVHRYHYEFPLEDMQIQNLDNVRVVIMVNKSEGSARYSTDNVIVCALNETKAFEYE